jgi:hypothetical protein
LILDGVLQQALTDLSLTPTSAGNHPSYRYFLTLSFNLASIYPVKKMAEFKLHPISPQDSRNLATVEMELEASSCCQCLIS